MTEFFKTVFGEYSVVQLLGYLWFFAVGYVIYGLTETTGRDVQSPHTPIKWSWKFWFFDNWRRYLTTILCSYVLFRFYIEVCGHPFGNFDAVSLGLIGDGIAATMKKRVTMIGADRKKLMEDGNNNENNGEHIEENNNEQHQEHYFGKPALPLDVLRKRFGQPWTKIYREEGISENTASEKNLYEIYNKLYQGQIDPSPFKDIKPTLEWLKKKD